MNDTASHNDIDLADVRRRLAGRRGRDYWKGLEEVAETPEFRQWAAREFPALDGFFSATATRRQVLKFLGASLALAGLNACTRQPTETIVPYVKAPEEIVPGRPLFYATTLPHRGFGRGVLVESHEGRPTKVEGNRLHPDSLGATDIFMQAEVLQLYDPDRSAATLRRGVPSDWSAFLQATTDARASLASSRGRGLRILTETVTSPSFAAQIADFLTRYPEARWHRYEPDNRDAARAGAQLAFGRAVDEKFDFSRARVILAADADFLVDRPGALRYARDYAAGRRPDAPGGMSRLYVAEPFPTVTGSMADHRFVVPPSGVETFLAAVAREIGIPVPGARVDVRNAALAAAPAIARDLRRHGGQSLVLAGEGQPPRVHALTHLMNARLGNMGTTVRLIEPVEAGDGLQLESLRTLVDDMDRGEVSTLLILGANPVLNAPSDLNFPSRLAKVPLAVHLGLYVDETARQVEWHVPQLHALESWGDARAYDGTISFVQPLIAPLYFGKTPGELLSAFADPAARTAHDLLTSHWDSRLKGADRETAWRRLLHDGIAPGTASPEIRAQASDGFLNQFGAPPANEDAPIDIVLRPDPTLADGRFANNGWMQELPKPLTKTVWDNAAFIGPKTAEKWGVQNGDHVSVRLGASSATLPAWIAPGTAENTVVLHYGYRPDFDGRIAHGAGTNVFPLRHSTVDRYVRGTVTRAAGRSIVATTQAHFSMENRDLVRHADADDYRQHPRFVDRPDDEPKTDETLYPPMPASDQYAWAMAIDLNACIGCGACTLACQAENNIPIVGKRQVLNSREMHWIRVDRYYQGSPDTPDVYHMPVPCMHCENAPCELVCPVGATTHSKEGLNEMTYNRCVGTRYCSNNCPYKVRRFNFLSFNKDIPEVERLQKNPDVTVRGRGVMEKCTYCVQRITKARINAEKERRLIRDGELETACQQVCPAEAIVFGNLLEPESRVNARKAEPRNYGILTDLNTRPRTTYLARLRNPNPEIAT